MQSQTLPLPWIFDAASRLSEWLRSRAARRLERRQAPRRMIANLDAHYFDGTAAAGHVVRDISTNGAFICAAFKWPPRTIVTLTLQLEGSVSAPSSPTSLLVQTEVVRCVPDGFGIRFLYVSKAERRSLANFLKIISEAPRAFMVQEHTPHSTQESILNRDQTRANFRATNRPGPRAIDSIRVYILHISDRGPWRRTVRTRPAM